MLCPERKTEEVKNAEEEEDEELRMRRRREKLRKTKTVRSAVRKRILGSFG